MLEFLIAEYLRDKENLRAVIKIIRKYNSSCIRIGNEEDKARKALEDLGELEVLKAFETGTFSGVT